MNNILRTILLIPNKGLTKNDDFLNRDNYRGIYLDYLHDFNLMPTITVKGDTIPGYDTDAEFTVLHVAPDKISLELFRKTMVERVIFFNPVRSSE